MSQKTREKYGIRLPVISEVSRGTGLTAAARNEFAREVEAAAPPAGAVWNNISRKWFVQTGAGMVPCDPQPPAPSLGLKVETVIGSPAFEAALRGDVPPAVKVSA